MRELCAIIGILRRIVNHFGHQLSMSDTITPQLIGNDLPGLSLMTPQQPFEESLGHLAIPAGPEERHRPLHRLDQLLATDSVVCRLFSRRLINEKSIAVTSMFVFHASGVFGTELVAP